MIDKSTWGPGPWQDEPDRLEWRHLGLPCLIVRSDITGALCGYVGVPPEHPFHGKDYGALDLDVHGGLTYSAPCQGHICHVPQPGEPDEVYWLGFDCAHYLDTSPAMDAQFKEIRIAYGTLGTFYRDLAYVRAETERLAEQIAEAWPS